MTAGGNSGIDGPELNWRRRRRCHRNFLVLQLGHSKLREGVRILQKLPITSQLKAWIHCFYHLTMMGFWYCCHIQNSPAYITNQKGFLLLLPSVLSIHTVFNILSIFKGPRKQLFMNDSVMQQGTRRAGGICRSHFRGGGRWRMSIHGSRHTSIWVRD